jgi:hypothetical protein
MAVYEVFSDDDHNLLLATDASVRVGMQATAACVVHRQESEVSRHRGAVGSCTAPDAELHAISRGVRDAIEVAGVRHVVVFTDSIWMARRSVDPSPHSNQSASLDLCRALFPWLAGDPRQHISFYQVPSALAWPFHLEAHEYCRALKVPHGRHLRSTLGRLRGEANDLASFQWAQGAHDDPALLGRNFLQLSGLNLKKRLLPSATKGGPWLREAGESNSLFARMCRCILNHAPIGSYYERFAFEQATSCPACGAPFESRSHILTYCPKYKRGLPVKSIHGLIHFLIENPQAFSFRPRPPAPEGVG